MKIFKMSRRSGGGPKVTHGSTRLLQFLNLIIVILLSHVRNAGAVHASGMCVQIGQANNNHLTHTSYWDRRRMGPWTIGTRKFDIIYDYLDFACDPIGCFVKTDNQRCPYTVQKDDILSANPCVEQSVVELRTLAVKQNGKVMYGWLHFEFELKDPKDEIIAIYVQVRDEFFNAIGEFVSDPNEQCEPTNSDLVQPTQYQILPCSAVGFREAKTSNAVFMANKHAFKKPDLAEKFIPKEDISRGIHFTWRLSEYWCNRHFRFRPEATIFTKKILETAKKVHPLIYRKAAAYWFKPRWYGAADIKRPRTTLSCNEPVIDYSGDGKLKKTGDGKLVAPWIEEDTVPGLLENDYLSVDQYYKDTYTQVHTLKSCQWNTRLMKPQELIDGGGQSFPSWKPEFPIDVGPTFAGRCTHHYEKTPSHNELQGCASNVDAEEYKDLFRAYPNLGTYSKFVNVLTLNRTNLCSVPCEVPTARNLTDIRSFNDTTGEGLFYEVYKYHGESREQSKVEKLVSGRRYHATLCVFWTMFLTPFGIYCARYFKETCMSVTCTGAHFWFWVHIATTITASAVFISSLSGIWSNLETWGRNTNSGGVAHRLTGYFSVALFFLLMILGGLRPLEKKKRRICMTVHSVIGFLVYFSNLVAMIFSFYIPGSPTIGDCDEEGFSIKLSNAIYPIIIWIFTDVVLHLAMTVIQMMKDRSVGLRRRWYCPIVPVLPHDSADDFVGASLRKITLIVYAGASLILTNTTIGLVVSGPPKNCSDKLGNSTCHEPYGCSPSALSYFAKTNNTKGSSGSYADLSM